MTEPIDWNDGYDDEPQRPRGGLWRRFWRSLTGSPTPDVICRPVSVLGADSDAWAATQIVWMYGTDEHSSQHAYTTIGAAQTEAIWEYDPTLAQEPEYWSWQPCPPQNGRLAMLCGDDHTGYTVYPVIVLEPRRAVLEARDAKDGRTA